MRLFEELRGLGYAGGYDAVGRYAAAWRRRENAVTAAAFVPLSFAPDPPGGGSLDEVTRREPGGEADQFDWSHEIVVLNGVTTIVKVAHLQLCYSRMPFVRAYPRASQAQRMRCGCSTAPWLAPAASQPRRSDRAFAFFKGACTRGIYDNMKTAVDTVFVGKERAYNGVSCRCARITWSNRSPAPRGGLGEGAGREPGPRRPAAVSASAVGRPVEIRAYAARIERRQDGRIVGEPRRVFGRGQTVYNPWHYVPVLARKPGARRSGAPVDGRRARRRTGCRRRRSSAGVASSAPRPAATGRWWTS